MYKVSVNISTEAGDVEKIEYFRSKNEALVFANNFVKPYLENSRTISGGWLVINEENNLEWIESPILKTNAQLILERLKNS